MSNRKLILNQLLEIGGVATLNNFYNPYAKTYLGSLVRVREHFKFYLEHGLIKEIDPIGKLSNPSRELFYCLTKKGARYIGREEEYKYKHISKSPNIVNVMHESAKFDVCLAFVRLYPDYLITVDYELSYGGIRPDATVILTPKNCNKKYTFFIEIERKKTVDRVFNEKLKRYEEVFNKLEKQKKLPGKYTILVVYSNLTYNVFTRFQEFKDDNLKEAQAVAHLTFKLASSLKYGALLPKYRYRFMAIYNFYRLNEKVLYKPEGEITALINMQ